jgi:hypothetical protein
VVDDYATPWHEGNCTLPGDARIDGLPVVNLGA